jgi:hypothetical protein
VSAPRYQLTPGGRLVHDPSAGGVGWRLLGANNRELGRSALAYPDAEDALEAVATVRLLATVGAAHIVHAPTMTPWVWQLENEEGVIVATAGRGFRHERECRYNLEQFREAAPSAPASDVTVPPQFSWQREAADALQPGAS